MAMDNTENPIDLQSVERDDNKPPMQHKNNLRSASAQILATLIQNWLLLGIGLASGAPLLVMGALYRNPSAIFKLDDDQASWFGSIPSVCHLIGSLVSGPIQEHFGRKGAMILINIPLFCSWMLLHQAHSAWALYAVVTIMGLCAGFSEAPLHSYCGEIGEPHIRGTLSTMSTSAFILGSLTFFFIGYFVEWRTAALISSACPVVTFVLMTQIPESPTWLIMQGRLEDARKSLCWLRGWVKPQEVKEEFEALVNYAKQRIASIEAAQLNGNDAATPKKGSSLKAQLAGLADKRMYLPLRMECFVIMNSYVTPLAGAKPYQIHIFNQLGYVTVGKLILIIGHVIFFTGTIGNLIFLRRFGKRKLALFAFGLSTVALFIEATIVPHTKDIIQIPGLFWLPIIPTFIIKFMIGLSIFPLPMQLLCEVFPPVGRGMATGVSAAWGALVDFVMLRSFLYLESLLTLSGVMYLYAAGAVIGWIYFYFYLPETEGKSLAQIEPYFTDDFDRVEKFSIGKRA